MSNIGIYTDTAVGTQDKGHLVVMLYEGAIKFLNQAIEAIDVCDYEAKGRLIGKAQDIIFELNTVLDTDSGGEIAQNLRQLYNYIWSRLNKANVNRDAEIIREVVTLMKELNLSWRAIVL